MPFLDHHEPASGRIIDIRSDSTGIGLKQQILDGISTSDGEDKTLPTLLLYDNKGLKLFEDITYLDEYYLTNEEINLLRDNAASIAEKIPNNSIVVELGSGNLRKVKLLLDALDNAGKSIVYYALDLMHSELERTLEAVPVGTFEHVKCFGLHGTYDDGLEWLKKPENRRKPKLIMSLGSSIGNFTREEAVGFLSQFIEILSPRDGFLIAIDACLDGAKVHKAYNDSIGTTHNFTLNGLEHANKLLGREAFSRDAWEAVGEYDAAGNRHRAFVKPILDGVEVEGVPFQRGEMVRIEESYKYSHEQSSALFASAGVIESAVWRNEKADYGLHLLAKSKKMFSRKPENYAQHPVPTLDEFEELWASWDNVTTGMVPNDELTNKPIHLRNAIIFYLGHIPTFLDIKLVEVLKLQPIEPKYFQKIFERGIDPDVDDPSQCHAHSEIPSDWPSFQVVLEYQERVRQRVIDLYASGRPFDDQLTGRALWLGFEHEVMHLETLIYILVQSDRTLPPIGVPRPDFEQLAVQAKKEEVPNAWFDIPAQTFEIGIDDPDNAEGPTRYFGWDVEKPKEAISVPAFKAQGRAITNEEYARYLLATKNDTIPKSWANAATNPRASGLVNGHTNGQTDDQSNGDSAFEQFIATKVVRTVYGPIALTYALSWPVAASYNELDGCAHYLGGRIPTAEETWSIYEYAERVDSILAKTIGKKIPAVNGHLINEGVQETPPTNTSTDGAVGGPDAKELYVNLDEANVGFVNWTPTPITAQGDKLAGRCGMGGLWEWTSSPLEKREGFEPMKLYPNYSADFYDGKHNIVLGGSWATHPRFAGRKSVVNWYQRKYPYAFIGARLVKDI